MNLRDLEYAEALARTLHFGDAAKACHVSQSTLSIQIKKLEESLGATLFERDARQVRLSETGQALLPTLRAVLEQAARLKSQAQTLRDPLSGVVRFGAFPTLAPYLLPHIMPVLNEALPNVQFQLVEEKTDTLFARLDEGSLDAALIALPITQPRFDALPLFAEPFLLAVKEGDFDRKRVDLHELAGGTLLLLDEGHCLRAQSLEVCARIGSGESQSYRATSLETLRHMVAGGAGATLMPALAMQKGDGVRYIPFTNPPPQREIALVYRSSTTRRLLFGRIAGTIRRAIAPIKPLKPLAAGRGNLHIGGA